LREPLSNVGYHVRRLAEAEALDLSRTEPGRSSVKHYYVIGSLVKAHRAVVEVVLLTA